MPHKYNIDSLNLKEKQRKNCFIVLEVFGHSLPHLDNAEKIDLCTGE